ncbi:CER3 [Symbiodinium sp. CCMP2456]|nr:CER3 [Symbiodinium sp. CCMP2456]
MYLLGPPLSLMIPVLWPLLRNGQGFEIAEDVSYAGVHMQNWVLACFGYQYLLWPFRSFVAARIAQSVSMAEKKGARVLCLGALNKAEWMNNGGLSLLRGLHGGARLVHGNTLTAAAVVEAARSLFGAPASLRAPIFVTGASSKVGAAVALRLLQLGYPVLAHSSDPERLRRLGARARQLQAEAASKLQVTTTLAKGVDTAYWVIGKHDPRVAQYLPRGSRAVVFSVPNPLEESRRKDVVWAPGGILRLDTARLAKPRQFSNLLAENEIYACHAAGIVTAAHADWKDELGEVCVDAMSVQWEAALQMGFSLPPLPQAVSLSGSPGQHGRRKVDVAVIGAGPSGLATAAALVEKGVDVVVLERQWEIQGSWQEHFEGLSITTRAGSCGLPGWPVKLVTGSDELAANDYVQYLRAYSARFGLDIRCGVEVTDIEDQSGRWCIFTAEADGAQGKWFATELVIATGKSVAPSVPAIWSSEPVLHHPAIVHSSQVRGPELQKAVAAAGQGELLVVGFGNSAADLCSKILAQVPGGTVHVSLRRVPPIMRRQWGPLRLEWFARLFSYACDKNGDRLAQLMMHLIEGDIQHLFPADLPRWKARQERHIPTIDRDGSLVRQLRDGSILVHRGIEDLEADQKKLGIRFRGEDQRRDFSTVVLCTGYRTSLECQKGLSRDAVRARAFFVGLGPEQRDLLPLQGIGREARKVAAQVSDLLKLRARQSERGWGTDASESSPERTKDKDL